MKTFLLVCVVVSIMAAAVAVGCAVMAIRDYRRLRRGQL